MSVLMVGNISGFAGLCATCRHAETVVSSRGATFYLCQLSLTDPRFPKYPTLPVLACGGYVRVPSSTEEQSG